jgi:hypothetical protein
MEKIEIRLQRAPDDPKVPDPKFQEELREFSKALQTAGVDYSQRGMAFDSADALGYLSLLWPALSSASRSRRIASTGAPCPCNPS